MVSRIFKSIAKWLLTLFVAGQAICFIAIGVSTLINGYSSLGQYSIVEVQSGSMEASGIGIGDCYVIKSENAYHVGDVVTFQHGETFWFHEIISIGDDGIIQTKGSSNSSADAFTITQNDIRGRATSVHMSSTAMFALLVTNIAVTYSIVMGVIVYAIVRVVKNNKKPVGKEVQVPAIEKPKELIEAPAASGGSSNTGKVIKGLLLFMIAGSALTISALSLSSDTAVYAANNQDVLYQAQPIEYSGGLSETKATTVFDALLSSLANPDSVAYTYASSRKSAASWSLDSSGANFGIPLKEELSNTVGFDGYSFRIYRGKTSGKYYLNIFVCEGDLTDLEKYPLNVEVPLENVYRFSTQDNPTKTQAELFATGVEFIQTHGTSCTLADSKSGTTINTISGRSYVITD